MFFDGIEECSCMVDCSAQIENRYNSGTVLRKVGIFGTKLESTISLDTSNRELTLR